MMSRTAKSLCVAAIAAFFVVGCTTVDDNLGLGFIPGDQQMTIGIDTVEGVKCYLTQTDSIASNSLGVVFLGKTRSDTYGAVTGSALMQFSPGTFANADNKFGKDAVGDSLTVNLYVNTFRGDVTKEQTFGLYKAIRKPSIDSTYYLDFDPYEPNKNWIEATPMATFTQKGAEHFLITLRGKDFQALNAYLQELVKAPDGVYAADTTFHNVFNGIYIGPTDASPQDAAMYRVTTEDSYLTLYAHFRTDEGKDSVTSLNYSLDDGNYSYNTSITKINHNYTGSKVGEFLKVPNDTLPTSTPVEISYVQSLGGVQTYMRFTDDFLNQIKALRNLDKHGEEYKNASMVINQARLVTEMKEPTPPLTFTEALSQAPGRLGMYYNYRKLTPIPDYYYSYEQSQNATLAYDGYLNRSHGYYSMDITTYVQQMLLSGNPGATPVQREIFLGPAAYNGFDFGEVTLSSPSSGENQIKLILTYTLIK